jgi:catechol 2,3-dioxygenase-like lactoylglutathione lyase family enzyme
METVVPGLHHVTAIAGDPQRNIDFYAGLLGLRLVKVTINYDDPGTYHFYYGDGLGRPGTIITFFPWAGGSSGRKGVGQATATAFAVPTGSLGYWQERLKQKGVKVETGERFGEEILSFADGDGLALELIANAGVYAGTGWNGSDVPTEYALRGFHSVTLSEAKAERTARFLTETMGFQKAGEEGNRQRFVIADGGAERTLDLLHLPDEKPGRVSVGTVHHVAWRTSSDATEAAWSKKLTQAGAGVSPVMDRQYFHSIYFQEPGSVLFEIATDPPGFMADGETAETLGTRLALPDWLEESRDRIEQILPVVRVPHGEVIGRRML